MFAALEPQIEIAGVKMAYIICPLYPHREYLPIKLKT